MVLRPLNEHRLSYSTSGKACRAGSTCSRRLRSRWRWRSQWQFVLVLESCIRNSILGTKRRKEICTWRSCLPWCQRCHCTPWTGLFGWRMSFEEWSPSCLLISLWNLKELHLNRRGRPCRHQRCYSQSWNGRWSSKELTLMAWVRASVMPAEWEKECSH